MEIERKVLQGPRNNLTLLKRRSNGSWHTVGKEVSLKAFHDGILRLRYKIVEWGPLAKETYDKYLEQKSLSKNINFERTYN